MSKGHRLNVWLPEEYRWLLDDLEELIQERESTGVMCSRSEVVRELLAVQLRALRKKRNEERRDQKREADLPKEG
jgi:metal-responsive CopG/Arc/MetJ family transcriptional regulator